MITSRHLMLCTLLALSFSSSANNLVTGQRLPLAVVADPGMLNYASGEFSYVAWNSAKLPGKARVLLHLAGRLSAKDENEVLTQKLQAAGFPHDRYQTTLIVNTDDAIPGSAMFVRASLKSSKEQSPWSQFIIDGKGSASQTWQLKPGGSTVAVLDKQGIVRFVKEGALTPAEVDQVMSLLKSLIQ